MDRIAVVHGDTDRVPVGGGTFGSRSMQQGGAAVQQVSIALAERARALAAELLEADPDTYYITEHYEGYTSVLVRLRRVHPDALRDLIAMAHAFMSSRRAR